VAIAALIIGLLILAQGLMGLAAPDAFVELVSWFQTPPVIYLAAVIRVMFGAVLVLAAAASRAPTFLRGLGALIVIGGALTPFIGVQFADVILGWWSEGGTTLVRSWAVGALVLGTLIVYASAPKRHAA
jgi:hypothetical protein